jgi:hypothetical protein
VGAQKSQQHRQVAILVKEKDQSFKTIGIRSLFGHFPTEKKQNYTNNQSRRSKKSSYNFDGGRFCSLFRGYGPENPNPRYLRPWAKRRRPKELLTGGLSINAQFRVQAWLMTHSLGGGKAGLILYRRACSGNLLFGCQYSSESTRLASRAIH